MCIRFVIGSLIALVAVTPSLGQTPLGTAFTYQGQLKENGAPIDGTAHLRFSLWDAAGNGSPPVGGSQLGASQLLANVAVSNGLFTVPLNAGGQFGANAFNGEARWLQVEVCADAGCGTLTILAPRQLLTAAPFAQHTRGLLVDAENSLGVGAPPPGGVRLFLQGTAALDSAAIKSDRGPNYSHIHFGPSGDWYIRSAAANGKVILQDSGGNVGIGTTTPAARLAVRGDGTDVLLGSAGCGAPTAAIGFGTMTGCTDFALGGNIDPGAAAGTFLNRSTGRSLHFRENNGPDQMTIAPGGSVGIGTTTPGAKLDVIAAEPFGIFGRNSAANSVGVFGQSTGTDSTGVLGRYDGPASTSGWGVFGFSPNGFAGVFGSGGRTGVFGETSSADDSGVYGKNNGNGSGVTGDSASGFAMKAVGNAVQSRDKGGWVKAMVLVDAFPPGPNEIVRCYNSQATGSTVSTPPCGFTLSSPSVGVFYIDFGFIVADRFASITIDHFVGRPVATTVQMGYTNANSAQIFIRYTSDNEPTNAGFYIIVY